MIRIALAAVVLFLVNSCDYDPNQRARAEMAQLETEVRELQAEVARVELRTATIEARYQEVREALGLAPE